MSTITVNTHVRVKGRPELGVGEVLRVSEGGAEYRADVAFESPDGRRLETLPLSRLERAPDIWERLALGDFDDPLDYALKQLAFQFPLANSGGELSCSRTDLLPHQILLTHDVVAASRRRLLVLLARQQMALEERAARSGDTTTAEKIQALEYEMRTLAIQILGLPSGSAQWAEAGAHVAQVKQRLARKAAEEETSWALDGDEEGAEVIYADTEIPGEAVRVRELLKLVPDGTDRKFDTLVRAIEDLRRVDPAEKFIIFTQYRETLEYLREELGKIYSANAIVTIKGGPLADKIAAVEASQTLGIGSSSFRTVVSM